MLFSELVDAVMKQTGRPDLKDEIVSYLNGTIRECQSLSFFHRDIEEAEVLTSSLTNYVWSRPSNFRQMMTVQYSNADFPEFVELGRRIEDFVSYYYATKSGYAFAGTDGSTSIKLAYATYLPTLYYYEENTSPALYDKVNNSWTYLVNNEYVSTVLDISDLNPADEDYAEQVEIRTAAALIVEESYRNKVNNWLTEWWAELLIAGASAKVFNVQNDRERANQVYAQYKQYQISLLKAESNASAGR